MLHPRRREDAAALIVQFIGQAPPSLFCLRPTERASLSAAPLPWSRHAREAAGLLVWHLQQCLSALMQEPNLPSSLPRHMSVCLDSMHALQEVLGLKCAAAVLGKELLLAILRFTDEAIAHAQSDGQLAHTAEEMRNLASEALQVLQLEEQRHGELLKLIQAAAQEVQSTQAASTTSRQQLLQALTKTGDGLGLGSGLLLKLAWLLLQLPALCLKARLTSQPGTVSAAVTAAAAAAGRWEILASGEPEQRTQWQQEAALLAHLLSTPLYTVQLSYGSEASMICQAVSHVLGHVQAAEVLGQDFLTSAAEIAGKHSLAAEVLQTQLAARRHSRQRAGVHGQYPSSDNLSLELQQALHGVSCQYRSSPSPSVANVGTIRSSNSSSRSANATRPDSGAPDLRTPGAAHLQAQLVGARIPLWMQTLGVPVAYMLSRQARPQAWACLHEEHAAVTASLWSSPQVQRRIQELLRFRPMSGSESTGPRAAAWLAHNWRAWDVLDLAIAAAHLKGCCQRPSGAWSCVLGNSVRSISAAGDASGPHCFCVQLTLR